MSRTVWFKPPLECLDCRVAHPASDTSCCLDACRRAPAPRSRFSCVRQGRMPSANRIIGAMRIAAGLEVLVVAIVAGCTGGATSAPTTPAGTTDDDADTGRGGDAGGGMV